MDYYQKSLDFQVIEPYTTINGLIFTPVENFNSDFGFNLVDTKTKERFKFSTKNRSLVFKSVSTNKFNNSLDSEEEDDIDDEYETESIVIQRRI